MSTAPQVIFLAGAPDRSSLRWDTDHLTTDLLPLFISPRKTPTSHQLRQTELAAPTQYPSWRSISLYSQPLHTGLTPPSQPLLVLWSPCPSFDGRQESTSFLSTSSLASAADDLNEGRKLYVGESAEATGTLAPTTNLAAPHASASSELNPLTQFLMHSFALHDSLSSSQIPADIPASSPSEATGALDSFLTTSTASTPFLSTRDSLIPLPFPAKISLTTLSALPSASRIRSLQPQTLTANLIVAVLSVTQPRTIIPKRGLRKPINLLELTVADDTRSGFGVNLWIPVIGEEGPRARGQTGSGTELAFGESARKLRSRDVLLLRNVALGEWRGAVYGQSLRRGVTRVDVLCRSVVDVDDEAGIWTLQDLEGALDADNGEKEKAGCRNQRGAGGGVMLRAARICQWMREFVGPGLTDANEASAARKRTYPAENSKAVPGAERAMKRNKVLPPDTQ